MNSFRGVAHTGNIDKKGINKQTDRMIPINFICRGIIKPASQTYKKLLTNGRDYDGTKVSVHI